MNMPFGKYIGQPIDDLPKHYLTWLSKQPDIQEPLKTGVQNVLAGKPSGDFNALADRLGVGSATTQQEQLAKLQRWVEEILLVLDDINRNISGNVKVYWSGNEQRQSEQCKVEILQRSLAAIDDEVA